MNYITHRLDQGQLGNMMFQVSTLIATAKKNNCIPLMPDWKYTKYFKHTFPGPLVREITHHYTEPHFHYTPIDLNQSLEQTKADDKVFNLTGYYQSVRYWDFCERLIKEQFEPKTETLQKVYSKYSNWIFSDYTCSVHVRRGDYVGNDYYAQLGTDYYEGAMFAMKNRTPVSKFLIFSDDIAWCKENFVSMDQDIEFIEGNSDIEDLLLMSLCTNNIIANSSFSFWGSYLNSNPDKLVMAPSKDKWFGKNTQLNVNDLYLPNWILL